MGFYTAYGQALTPDTSDSKPFVLPEGVGKEWGDFR